MRGFPRAFWILIAGAFVNRLGGFVIPLLAIYLRSQRGLRVEQIGVVVSLWGVGAVLAGPCGGFLADHLGRRRTLLASLVAGAMAMLHLAIARHPAHIALAAMLLGLFGDMYRPAVSASIADVVPPGRRAQAYGILYWVVNLGFAVAASLGGLLADRSFTLLFVSDAVTTLLFAGVILGWAKETRPEVHEERASPWAPLLDGPFVAFCALIATISLLFIQAFVTLPLFVRDLGLPSRAYGALISINGFLIAILQPFVARALERFRRSHVLALSAALIGAGFAATAAATGVRGVAASIVVWTLGEIAMAGLGPAVVADVAPAGQRGAYQGLFQMAWAVSLLVGPLAGSQLLGRFGAGTLWLACGGVGAVVALGHLALGDLAARRREQASAA